MNCKKSKLVAIFTLTSVLAISIIVAVFFGNNFAFAKNFFNISDTPVYDDIIEIDSMEKLNDLFKKGGKGIVVADFAITKELTTSGKTSILDMQTFKITETERGFIKLTKGAKLNIEGNGKITTDNISEREKGGMIYIEGQSTLDLSGCTLSNSKAKYGGALYVENSTLKLNNTTITQSEASENGGGIYLDAGSSTYLLKSTLSDNKAKLGGGLYANRGTTTKTDETEIARNTAFTSGGGFYSSGSFSLEHTKISKNVSYNGGGIFSTGHMNIENTEIIQNEAKTFSNILDSNLDPCCGGGIYTTSTLSLSSSKISENICQNSTYSGGMFIGDGEVTINSGEISSNDGGIRNEGTLTISSGNISANKNCGIMNCNSTTMYNGNISNNKSDEDGGGVYNAQNAKFTLNGGKIEKNEAVRAGGGLYNSESASFNMFSGSILSNVAPSGSGVMNAGKFDISDGIISSNTTTKSQTEKSQNKPAVSPYEIGCGAGIYNIGTVNIYDSGGIHNNTSDKDGGGIYNDKYGNSEGITRLMGGYISDNSANNGGGLFISKGELILKQGTVVANKAKTGGGVYYSEDEDCKITLDPTGSTEISGNTKQQKQSNDSAAPNNLYLPEGKVININDAEPIEAAGNPYIGIKLETLPSKNISIDITSKSSKPIVNMFTSDDGCLVEDKSDSGHVVIFKDTTSATKKSICDEKTFREWEKDGGFGEVTDDFTLPESKTNGDISINVTKPSVLYLNGHTITLGEGDDFQESTKFEVAGINLKIIAKSGDKTGKIVFKNKDKQSGALNISSGGHIEIKDLNELPLCTNIDKQSSLTLSGGSIKLPEKKDATKDYVAVNNSGTAIIDGEISGAGTGIVNSGMLLVNGGKISGNTVGGGINNSGNCMIAGGEISGNTSEIGAGVYTCGIFTMKGGTIKENHSVKGSGNLNEGGGGGVYIANQSNKKSFNTMIDGTIESNDTKLCGGGIHIEDGCKLEMFGGKISKNQSQSYGAGISAVGKLDINAGEISENTTDNSNGGGIFSKNEFYLNGGKISKNKAAFGAGVYVYGEDEYTNKGSFHMYDGEISENEANNGGGGVCNAGNFTMMGGKISKNKSGQKGNGVYNKFPGEFTLNQGNISENTSDDSEHNQGGNVYNDYIFNATGGQISSGKAVNGGGVYNTGILEFYDLTINGNTATNNGGGVYTDVNEDTPKTEKNTVFKNVTITGNKAKEEEAPKNKITNCGGGIYYASGNSFMERNTVSSCEAALGAGIFSSDKSIIEVNNSSISGNTSSDSGGGMSVYGNVTLNDSVINQNSASKGSGIFCGCLTAKEKVGAKLTLNSGKITENKLSDPKDDSAGVGIYVCDTFDFTMNGGEISKNNASSQSGDKPSNINGTGIYNMGNTTINSGVISSNEGAVYGAGIYNAQNAVLTVSDVSVEKNTSGKDGAGLYISASSKANISGGYYKQNTSLSGNGAGICYEKDSTASDEISNVNITDNSALKGYGGGLYLQNTTLSITNSDVSKNKANRGAGVATLSDSTKCELKIKNTNISENSASEDGGGLYSVSNVVIDDSSTDKKTAFDSNTATNGAGLYNKGSMNLVTICDIQSNIAKENGGGMYNAGTFIYESQNKKNQDRDLIFKENSATNGGGLYNLGKTYSSYSNFTDNKSESSCGGGLYNGGTFEGKMIYFGTNTATYGGGLYNCRDDGLKVNTINATKNIAFKDGGGIYNCAEVTLQISQITCTYNTANGNGAGVYNKSTINLLRISEDTSASFNAAGNSADNCGGGVYNDTSGYINSKLNRFSLNNNVAKNGAGIYNKSKIDLLPEDDEEITSLFEAKKNNSEDCGGALYNDADGLFISKTDKIEVMSNYAPKGGGIYHNGKEIELATNKYIKVMQNATAEKSDKESNLCLAEDKQVKLGGKARNDDYVGICVDTAFNIGKKIAISPSPDFLETFKPDDSSYALEKDSTTVYLYAKGEKISNEKDLQDFLNGNASFAYLDQDIEIERKYSPLEVTNGNVKSLDFNGKQIDFKNSESGIQIDAKSTLNILNTSANVGKITTSESQSSKAILSNSGICSISGINLTDSHRNVCINNEGELKLEKTQITNNTVDQNGVAIYNSGKVTIGSDVTIENNKFYDGEKERYRNLYLEEGKLVDISEPMENSRIGISTQDKPSKGSSITIAKEQDKNYSDKFFSDDESFFILSENIDTKYSIKLSCEFLIKDSNTLHDFLERDGGKNEMIGSVIDDIINYDGNIETKGNHVLNLNGHKIDLKKANITVNKEATLQIIGSKGVSKDNDCIYNGHSADMGGAVCNYGNLIVANVTMHSNSATKGGAIYNEGSCELKSCNIARNNLNKDGNGAGVYENGAKLLVNEDVIVSNNKTSDEVDNNMYLAKNKFVTIGSNGKEKLKGIYISITTEEAPTSARSITLTKASDYDYSDCFKPENNNFIIRDTTPEQGKHVLTLNCGVPIKDMNDLINFFKNGGTGILEKDITIENQEQIVAKTGKKYSLDMNSHTVDLNKNNISVNKYSELNIIDTSPNKSGTIKNGSSSLRGGAINNSGTLKLSNILIERSKSQLGGALYNGLSGKLTLENSCIKDNIAGKGGGVFNEGIELNLDLNTKISGNKPNSDPSVENNLYLATGKTINLKEGDTFAEGSIGIVTGESPKPDSPVIITGDSLKNDYSKFFKSDNSNFEIRDITKEDNHSIGLFIKSSMYGAKAK